MVEQLAMHGGRPVRAQLLPYGRQTIDDDDIAAMSAILRSGWLTTGPTVGEFERVFADFVGTREAVAVSNGTAALHACTYALGIGPGDEVIVPAMTFAATANCIVYQGGKPVFADVHPDTLLIDPIDVEKKITPRTRAIIAVDYAGQPCNYDALLDLAASRNLTLVADACHALGAEFKGKQAGAIARLSTFSFHPVKHIATGEGGMITTDDSDLAQKMRTFRNHGITTDHRKRERMGTWAYEMVDLGYNYRITDIQCALGISQLKKLPRWVTRRREIARTYQERFANHPAVLPLKVDPAGVHAYHLFVVRLVPGRLKADRREVFSALRAEGIGVQVHYIPVHLHPYYQSRFGTGPGLCPNAETAYEQILSLPIFPSMTDADVYDVVRAVHKVTQAYAH